MSANEKRNSNDKKWGFVALLFTVLLLGGGLRYVGCVSEDTPTLFDKRPKERIAKEIAEADAIRITAEAFGAEYEANEIAADQKYKGKVVELSGKILSIHAGSSGPLGSKPSLSLHGRLLGIKCEFMANEQLQSLTTGQMVTVRGKCSGRSQLQFCQLVSPP